MATKTAVTVDVKIDLAACLRVLALFVFLIT
jgi:hypothetical protein